MFMRFFCQSVWNDNNRVLILVDHELQRAGYLAIGIVQIFHGPEVD